MTVKRQETVPDETVESRDFIVRSSSSELKYSRRLYAHASFTRRIQLRSTQARDRVVMHAQPSGVCDVVVGVEERNCTAIALSKQIWRKLEIVVDGDMVEQQAGSQRCQQAESRWFLKHHVRHNLISAST